MADPLNRPISCSYTSRVPLHNLGRSCLRWWLRFARSQRPLRRRRNEAIASMRDWRLQRALATWRRYVGLLHKRRATMEWARYHHGRTLQRRCWRLWDRCVRVTHVGWTIEARVHLHLKQRTMARWRDALGLAVRVRHMRKARLHQRASRCLHTWRLWALHRMARRANTRAAVAHRMRCQLLAWHKYVATMRGVRRMLATLAHGVLQRRKRHAFFSWTQYLWHRRGKHRQREAIDAWRHRRLLRIAMMRFRHLLVLRVRVRRPVHAGAVPWLSCRASS